MSAVVLHIPHSSKLIPGDLRRQILLSDDELELEICRMTDAYTDELFESESSFSVTFPVSRLVVDPERFLDDASEPMAARGMGVVYSRTSQGEPLRAPLDAEVRRALIARFYTPHHAALERRVDETLARQAECIVVDCHSFPDVRLRYEDESDAARPDLCIGTDGYHTPDELVELLADEADMRGWSVLVNEPFSGSIVPEKHYRKKASVMSVMLEVNRKLYMDETSGAKGERFEETRETLQYLLSVIDGWRHETQFERIREQGDMLAEQYWDSGGPGAGAGYVTAFDYHGVFLVVGDAGLRICPSREEAIRDATAETDATVSVDVCDEDESFDV